MHFTKNILNKLYMFTAKYLFVLSNFVKAESGRILNTFPYFKIIRHFTSEWTNTKYVSTFKNSD